MAKTYNKINLKDVVECIVDEATGYYFENGVTIPRLANTLSTSKYQIKKKLLEKI